MFPNQPGLQKSYQSHRLNTFVSYAFIFHLSMSKQATATHCPCHIKPGVQHTGAQWESWQSGGATGDAHREEGLYTSPWQAGLSRQGLKRAVFV